MDFNRKARWALNGYRQPSPEGSTYTGVVPKESFRIVFTHAALNDADIWACDI